MSSMSKRGVFLYVTDILEAIEKIISYTKNLSFPQFKNDTKTIDAVVRNLEVIGEAARNMPKNIRLDYPDIPWKQVIGARNKVLHEYFGVDEEILWKTIQDDMPILKEQIESLKKTIE